MNRIALVAAAAAVGAAVLGGTLLLAGGQPGPAVQAPSPTATASPAAVNRPVPEELQFGWLGELRNVEGLETDRSIMGFTESESSYEGLVSTAGVSTDGILAVTANVSLAGCRSGDEGTYRFTLSPGGTKLTIVPLEDACAARSAAMAGDWLRSSCLNPDNLCLGPLEAGEYASFFIDPRLAIGDDWAPRFGALRYTVPEGWAATADFPQDYFLEPADWYASNRGDISATTRGVYVLGAVAPRETSGGCSPPIDDTIPRSAEAIAAWIPDHPGIIATQPEGLSINGVAAWVVDVELNPEWTGVCSAAPTPVAMLFGQERQWGPHADERHRYVLLDVAEDRPVLIDVSEHAVDFDAKLPELMQIVESFRFE